LGGWSGGVKWPLRSATRVGAGRASDFHGKAGEKTCGKSKRKSGCTATAAGSWDTEHVQTLAPCEDADPIGQCAGITGFVWRMGQLEPEQHEG